MTVKYEPGMRIIYDSTAKRATVCFRGRVHLLDGLYMTGTAAKEAGEAYCRAAGWNPNMSSDAGRSLLRHRMNPPYMRT